MTTTTPPTSEMRSDLDEAGFEPDLVRDLIRALSHDALDDEVTDLLFEHVVMGRHHPSVIANSLPLRIEEILGVATAEDWRVLAEVLIVDGSAGDGRVARESAGTERRVSEQGTRFDVGLIRDFLWMALTHQVAEVRLGDLRLGLRSQGPLHPSAIGGSLREIVEDSFRAATEEDWNVITGQLIAEARAVDGEV